MKIFSVSFWKTLVASGTAIVRNSEIEDNLARNTKIPENFSNGSTVQIAFLPGISKTFRMNSSPFGNSKILYFLDAFLRGISIPSVPFSKFSFECKEPPYSTTDEVATNHRSNLLHYQYLFHITHCTFQENIQNTLV